MSETREYLPPIHTSPETAFVIADYPYGRTLRCKKRVWIETTKKGQRVVYQTTNPKLGGEVWNKPKASTYSDVCVLYVDKATGYLEWTSVSVHAPEERLQEIERDAAVSLTERDRNEIKKIRAVAKAFSRVTFTIGPASEPIDVFGDPNAAEKLDRLAQEQEASKAKERRLMGALIANEVAAANGQALPVPKLGTADQPPSSAR